MLFISVSEGWCGRCPNTAAQKSDSLLAVPSTPARRQLAVRIVSSTVDDCCYITISLFARALTIILHCFRDSMWTSSWV